MYFVEFRAYLERVPCVRALSAVSLSVVAGATPGSPLSFPHMLAHLILSETQAKKKTYIQHETKRNEKGKDMNNVVTPRDEIRSTLWMMTIDHTVTK